MNATILTRQTRLRWLLLAVFALVLLMLMPLFTPQAGAQDRPRPTPRTEREGRTASRTSKERAKTERPARTERSTTRTTPRGGTTERTRRTTRTTGRGTTRTTPRGGSVGTTDIRSRRSPVPVPDPPRQTRRDDRRTNPTGGRRGTSQTDAERQRNDRYGDRRDNARRDDRRDERRREWREERRAEERRRARDRRTAMQRERYRYQRRYQRDWYRRYHRDWYRHHQARTWHRRVDIHWPWVIRLEHRWRPRYQYRQVVYVEVGYGARYRESRVEVRTVYRHRLIDATSRRAQLDIEIERLELYDDGRFLGEITRIPEHLSHFGATVYRNGEVRFDRDVFVVGDPYSGFELVATRSYGGYVLDEYQAAHGYEAAALDFSRRRAVPVRRSRLFRPGAFDGHVPITLLPEDQDWLYDYGYGGVSAHYDDRGADYYYDSSAGVGRLGAQPLARTDEQTFTTGGGAQVRMVREAAIERIE